MPGNEVGDRVHNFFEQGSLSQEQRHTQFGEAFNDNVWGANERQIGGPLSSNSKNYSPQQSDIERVQNNQFSVGSHGLNFMQSNLRPEFLKSPSQHQQLNLNGYMYTSQAVNTRQNEANFLGADTGSDRHNLTSRGLSFLESQQRGASQHTNSTSFGGSESPMNFNFLGGQQQMSGQQSGMLHSVPRQTSAINDAQFLQQQAMFKQMQELQRQQQLQQVEAMQRSAMGHMPNFQNQTSGQHSSAMNGNSMHGPSSYSWQSQVMGGNTNWQQPGHPSAMHSYSNGHMVTPEQSQAMRFMGLTPHQASQSLYGVPVSGSRGANPFFSNSLDKSAMHVPTQVPPFPGNPYASQAEHASMQEGITVSRSGSEGRSSFEHSSSQGLGNVGNLGSFSQAHQRNVPMPGAAGQGYAGGQDVLPEKSTIQADTSQASSQAAVGLDPTEEKILFGSDDNIWDAFGGTVGPSSAPGNDAPDLLNGFSSMQSGTWSALMQSAVAETSSGDGGVQEEWSGLGSRNSISLSGNQQSTTIQENDKGLPVWVDSSQRAPMGSRTTNNDGSSNNSTSQNSHHQSFGVQQTFSNQRSSPAESRVLHEGRRWLDGNQPNLSTGEKQLLENNCSSRDISKTDTGLWGHQQNAFFQPNSNVKMGMSHGLANVDAVGPNLSNTNVGHESSQMLPDTHSLDLWKPANSSVRSGIDGLRNAEHSMAKGQSILDTSANTPDGGGAEMQWTENGEGRENSTDSHRSSISNHGQAGSLRENVWSDTGDRHSSHGGAEKSSGQPGRLPATRKFQYHPMGDVDVDPSSFAVKESSQSPSMSQHLPSGFRVSEAQQKFSSDMEKGRASNYQGAVRMSHGAPFSGLHPGHLRNTPAPFPSSGENSSMNQMPTGQHMLELLHKVDQSKDQGAVAHLGSSDYNRLPDVSVSGHGAPAQIQSSASHGFNLQLAPPSRGVASSNPNDPAQSSLTMAGSPNSGYATFDKGEKHAWLTPGYPPQCLPSSHRSSKMESGSDQSSSLGDSNAESSQPNLKGNRSALSASPSPHLRNPFQNQHMIGVGGQMMVDQSVPMSSDSHVYHDQHITNSNNQAIANQSFHNLQSNMANQSGISPSARQMPASLHAAMAKMTKDSVPPVGLYPWISQKQLLGAQASSAADILKSQFQSNATLETNSVTQPKDEPDAMKRIDDSRSKSIVGEEDQLVAEARSPGKTTGAAQEDSPARHSMDASPSSSAAVQKDTDTFQQSVKSSNATHQNFSQLQQMQVMKSMGLDPSHRESKRLRGPDDGPDAQQGMVAEPFTGGMNSMVGDPSLSRTSISGGDARMLNFSPQSLNRIASSQFPHGAATSQDMLSFGRSDPQTFAAGSFRPQHTDISPQMAPSWFEQHGAFKDGQLLPINNVPRVPLTKISELQLISGKSPNNFAVQNSVQSALSLSDTSQVANNSQITNACTPSDHNPALQALVPQAPIPSSVSMRPKKRKTATSDLLPWSKEIGQFFKRLHNLSSAEAVWAHSSNRLVERVEDETETHEELLPMVRSRRRLILTTQLMQQVFRPPSALILSLDATTNYEVVIYSIARAALGDACSLVSSTESDSAVESGKALPEKAKTPQRLRDQYFSKVVDDFMNRAKELENDLLRLDKGASILDFRLDYQDLERFSVINRFARFHGRSQADGAETSSSSDATTVAQKHFPQRYVYAHPMPRTVPDRVQCLSL